MVFEIVEALREVIADSNDKILEKLAELENKNSLDTALKTVYISSEVPMSYTPVNAETFAKWCKGYMEHLQKIKEERKTEKDLKPTGRQIFEMSKKGLMDIKLEEEGEEDAEEFKDQNEAEDSEDDEAFYYDRALYDNDANEEEVDFD